MCSPSVDALFGGRRGGGVGGVHGRCVGMVSTGGGCWDGAKRARKPSAFAVRRCGKETQRGGAREGEREGTPPEGAAGAGTQRAPRRAGSPPGSAPPAARRGDESGLGHARWGAEAVGRPSWPNGRMAGRRTAAPAGGWVHARSLLGVNGCAWAKPRSPQVGDQREVYQRWHGTAT